MNIVNRPKPQFTGCVDSCGDPLYIGDIVQFAVSPYEDMSKPVTLGSIIGIVRFGKYWVDKQPQRGFYIQWANPAFANSLQNFVDAESIVKIGEVCENADLCQLLAVQMLNYESIKFPFCDNQEERKEHG